MSTKRKLHGQYYSLITQQQVDKNEIYGINRIKRSSLVQPRDYVCVECTSVTVITPAECTHYAKYSFN